MGNYILLSAFSCVDLSSSTSSVIVSMPSCDLRLFYINDIHFNTSSTVRLFEDDTLLYMTVACDSDNQVLQNDLDRLLDWSDKWMMVFHPNKCNVLRISKKQNPTSFQFQLRGHPLATVPAVKYLGIKITNDFST